MMIVHFLLKYKGEFHQHTETNVAIWTFPCKPIQMLAVQIIHITHNGKEKSMDE